LEGEAPFLKNGGFPLRGKLPRPKLGDVRQNAKRYLPMASIILICNEFNPLLPKTFEQAEEAEQPLNKVVPLLLFKRFRV